MINRNKEIRQILHEVFDNVYNFDIKNLTNMIINDYIIGDKHHLLVMENIDNWNWVRHHISNITSLDYRAYLKFKEYLNDYRLLEDEDAYEEIIDDITQYNNYREQVIPQV